MAVHEVHLSSCRVCGFLYIHAVFVLFAFCSCAALLSVLQRIAPLLALAVVVEGCRIVVKASAAGDEAPEFRLGGTLDAHDVKSGESAFADSLTTYYNSFITREAQLHATSAVVDQYQSSRFVGRPLSISASAAGAASRLGVTAGTLVASDLERFPGLSPSQRQAAAAVDLLLSGRAVVERKRAGEDWIAADVPDVRLEWEALKFMVKAFVPKLMEVCTCRAFDCWYARSRALVRACCCFRNRNL